MRGVQPTSFGRRSSVADTTWRCTMVGDLSASTIPVRPDREPCSNDSRPPIVAGRCNAPLRNGGRLVDRTGTPGPAEREIVDTENITSTIVQRQVVSATDDLLPNEVGWTPRIDLAPLTPVDGWYTIIVQLGSEIVSLDYLMSAGQVVE